MSESTSAVLPVGAGGKGESGAGQHVVDHKFVVRWFSPRWFILVMGTGALANVYQMLSGSPTGLLHGVAVFLLLLGLVAFLVVSGLKLVRALTHWDAIVREFGHSSLMQFYAAIPIAAAVLSTGLLNIPLPVGSETGRLLLAEGLWWTSVILSLVFIVVIPTRVVLGDHAEPRRALGFWFLPPVGLFVLVFNGNFLAGRLGGAAAQAIFELNTLVLGLAIFLTVSIFVIFMLRAMFYKFPAPDVAPSYLIGLAPIGVSIIALNSYAPLYAKMAPVGLPAAELVAGASGLLSLLLWGFGLWWLAVCVGILVYKARTTRIPFSLGYGALVFPPAAYTLATLLLASKYPFGFLEVAGQALAVAVSLVWLTVTVLTALHIRTRRVFMLPASFQEILAEPGADGKPA